MRSIMLALALTCPPFYMDSCGMRHVVHHYRITTSEGVDNEVCGTDALIQGDRSCVVVKGQTNPNAGFQSGTSSGVMTDVLSMCNVVSLQVLPPVPPENPKQ